MIVAKTKTPLAYNNGSRLVVTGPYICYALQKGKLRVINLETTEKCLVRPAGDAPQDVRVVDVCPCNHPNLPYAAFAMVTSDGWFRASTIVERDSEDGSKRQPEVVDILAFRHPAAGGVGRSFQRVVWRSRDVVALADGMNAVCIKLDSFDVKLLSKLTQGEESLSEIEMLQRCGATVMRGHKSDVSDLTFSTDGTQLVTASDDGTVRVWDVTSGLCVHSFEPEEGRPVSSVSLLTPMGVLSDAMSSPCLIGTDRDSFLQLYERMSDSGSGNGEAQQKIDLKVGPEMHEIGNDGYETSEWVHMYNRCIWEPNHGVLLCRNVRVKEEDVDESETRSEGTIFMFRLSRQNMRFDWCNEIELQVPVISMVFGQPDSRTIKAFCVQTTAIQMYTLRPDKIFGPKSATVSVEKVEERGEKSLVVTAAAAESSFATTDEKVAIDLKQVESNNKILSNMLVSLGTTASKSNKSSSSNNSSNNSSSNSSSSKADNLVINTVVGAEEEEAATTRPQLLSPMELLKSISPRTTPPRAERKRRSEEGGEEKGETKVVKMASSPRNNFEEIDDTVGGREEDAEENAAANGGKEMLSSSSMDSMMYLLEQGYTEEQARRGETFLLNLRNDSDLTRMTNTHSSSPPPTSSGLVELSSTSMQTITTSVVEAVREPVLEAYRGTMEEIIIPSFESIVSEMLAQVSTTLRDGIQEHSKKYVDNKMSKNVDTKLKQMSAKIDKLSQLTQTVEILAQSVKKLAEVAELTVAHRENDASLSASSSSASASAPSTTTSSSSSSAAIAAAAVAPPAPDMKTQIATELDDGNVQNAFWLALNAEDHSIVKWTCSQISPDKVVGTVDQLVLLSLIQQLGINVMDDTKEKLHWLQECAVGLNISDAQIRAHIPSVFDSVGRTLDANSGQFVKSDHPLRGQYQLVQHLFKSTAMLVQQNKQ